MSPEQQRIAIAEACGPRLFVIYKVNRGYYLNDACGYTDNIELAWQVPEEIASKHATGPSHEREPDRIIKKPAPLPAYTADLDAMHEAEKVLTAEQWVSYWSFIEEVVKDISILHATAAQRAEAFLRAIGAWKEANK